MKIYKLDGGKDNEDALLDIKDKGSAVALGRFDAIHAGHIKIIQTVVNYAKENSLMSVVFMFVNDPLEITGKKQVPNVNTNEGREKLLEGLGVDAVVEKKFDVDFMNLSCEDFADLYLNKILGAKFAAAGFNYHFGRGGRGDTDTLKRLCDKYHIKVNITDEVKTDGQRVSSTKVRENVKEGRISDANKMLGRRFSVEGRVINGNGIGRTIGFATANISMPKDMIIPKCGVYVTVAKIDGKSYRAITNVGKRPTVNEERSCIETHIIDESMGDLYGKDMQVEFVEYIRDIQKFSDLAALSERLKKDKKIAAYVLKHIKL